MEAPAAHAAPHTAETHTLFSESLREEMPRAHHIYFPREWKVFLWISLIYPRTSNTVWAQSQGKTKTRWDRTRVELKSEELSYRTETGSQTQKADPVTKGERLAGRDTLGLWLCPVKSDYLQPHGLQAHQASLSFKKQNQNWLPNFKMGFWKLKIFYIGQCSYYRAEYI